MDSEQSEIAEWYRGRSVFVTGATGFMGKVLVEKLLRSCPDVGTIFLLVRKKKDMSSRDRVQKMLTSRLFDEFRATNNKTNPMDKIVAIAGDIALPELGISAEDRHLLQEKVSVVFHVAATVKFDEHLRLAVAMNIEGTESVLRLSQGMTNLSAIVHVSTAYTNCSAPIIRERVYPPPFDPEKLAHCVAGLDDDILEFITPRLIDKQPTTYTFTKALAEHVVAGYSTKLPIVVVRPSIVSASWKEPIPGWVDNYNGPTTLVVSSGKGLLDSVYGKTEVVADLIPVDLCINLFIAAAWEIGSREGTKLVSDVLVYNCVSRPFNPVTWALFVEEIRKCIRKYALNDVVMTPNLTMTDSRVRHTLTHLVGQTLPVALADCFIWISGGKPRYHRYRRKINKVAEMLEFFTTQEWKFEAENVERLKNRLSPVDRVIFDFDATKIVWKEYVTSYFLGIRRNVLHEKDDTFNTAKKRVARLALMSKIVQFGVLGILAIGVFHFYDVLQKL